MLFKGGVGDVLGLMRSQRRPPLDAHGFFGGYATIRGEVMRMLPELAFADPLGSVTVGERFKKRNDGEFFPVA